MQRLRKVTDEEWLIQIDTSRQNKIVRDLVTQMFAIDPKPIKFNIRNCCCKQTSMEVSFMGSKVSGFYT